MTIKSPRVINSLWKKFAVKLHVIIMHIGRPVTDSSRGFSQKFYEIFAKVLSRSQFFFLFNKMQKRKYYLNSGVFTRKLFLKLVIYKIQFVEFFFFNLCKNENIKQWSFQRKLFLKSSFIKFNLWYFFFKPEMACFSSFTNSFNWESGNFKNEYNEITVTSHPLSCSLQQSLT